MFNGTCLRGFTYKKYLCVCQDGYWGENCERGEAYCACYTRLSFVRHSGEISEHACNAREILRVQRNGNDSISSVTVLRKNGGILKISIVCFHFAKQKRSPFSRKFLCKLPRHISHSTEKNFAVTDVNLWTKKSIRNTVTSFVATATPLLSG